MEHSEIQDLLAPYLDMSGAPDVFWTANHAVLDGISTYIDILIRWNERTNLTAVRDAREMVQRHFGESLFAAQVLLARDSTESVIDLGSGAGFPGLPLKIWARGVHLTLVESQNKKVTFLREVIRALDMDGAEVAHVRGEALGRQADLVTMRAVEKFEEALAVARSLCAAGGRLGLLIGAGQVERAKVLLEGFSVEVSQMPKAESRVVLVAKSAAARGIVAG